MKYLTKGEKIKIIEEGIRKVAPEKMICEINDKTSITNDLCLDSIQIMDLLIEIKSIVNSRCEKEEDNMDKLLGFLFEENDDLLTESLCEFIDKI